MTALSLVGCQEERLDSGLGDESETQSSVDVDDQLDIDSLDLIAGEDPEVETTSYYGFQKILSKFVRLRAQYKGLEPMPAAPEVRPELVALGQALAFDKELSGNRDISCMTCHHPSLGSDDDLSLSIGVGGVGLGAGRTHPHDIFIPRNAPPLFNLHDLDTMFWDGRVNPHGTLFPMDTPANDELPQEVVDIFEFGSVSAQAMFPVTSRAEMRGALGENELANVRDDDLGGQWSAIMARLGQIPEYVEMFEAAYPGTNFEDMHFAHAANAIAGFEVSGFQANDTPWDQMLRGDDHAMSVEALLGANHFMGKANCVACHNGSSLSDEDFHNTALPQFGPGKNDGATLTDDWGRYNETDDPADFYHFRTAPLRNVALTGPWGHAGQFTDLEGFVRHYLDPETSLNEWDPTQIDPKLQGSVLNTQEAVLRHISDEIIDADFREHRVDEMMAFMDALTDPDSQDLLDTIPPSVPSGLTVDDDVLVEPENREGTMDLFFGLPGSFGREFQFYTPEMCAGGGLGQVSFDREENTLAIDATIQGLPYRPTTCYDYNPSTPFNEYPDCVEDGRWQLWIVPRMFNKITTFYYDFADGSLLGSEFDDIDPLPPTAVGIPLPSLQMLCSDFFESDPQTLTSQVHFEYDYDNMLDMRGSAGTIFAIAPYNIFNPNDLGPYYVDGGLPASEAMDFDDFVELNAEGKGGFVVAMSYEPFPKPEYLASRDNLMLGFAAQWPLPDIYETEFFTPPVECGENFQWPFPGVGFDPEPQP